MVWEGLVYKVLRISLGKYEDCNDTPGLGTLRLGVVEVRGGRKQKHLLG